MLTSASNVGKTDMAIITAAERTRQRIREAAHAEALAVMKQALIADGYRPISADCLCAIAGSELRQKTATG